jgi:hypothetical protein
MVGLPFRWNYSGKVRYVSYGAGNPMGAYSSWASFALANHYIVYLSCIEVGVEWSQCKYCLLGDDIVIGHKEVAEAYIRLLKSLGVEISELKTHKSQHLYEFAKRQIYKGLEISPFPISALKESMSRYYRMTNLLIEQSKRG